MFHLYSQMEFTCELDAPPKSEVLASGTSFRPEVVRTRVSGMRIVIAYLQASPVGLESGIPFWTTPVLEEKIKTTKASDDVCISEILLPRSFSHDIPIYIRSHLNIIAGGSWFGQSTSAVVDPVNAVNLRRWDKRLKFGRRITC